LADKLEHGEVKLNLNSRSWIWCISVMAKF